MYSCTRTQGFTLIELMIVVTVLGIVMAIGIPSFNTMIMNNRLAAASNDVAGALHFARAEAVRRGRSVQVEALDNNVTNGLRIWFDADGDGGFDNGEELRVVRLPASAGVAVSGAVNGTAATDLDMSYSPRGVVSSGDWMTFTVCDDRSGNHGKQLTLLASGLLRLTPGVACN
ncbi:type IV fimbrial biogenesis protein FimT [Microbulbifer donghaiensis]|uniref:Type II secretion system protein H n=1 Tax=Microbulbifer donghaiensis TaxID=494016 RepID=A0A1M5HW88_9GAMM|nr:GspH/FimT family pseudopilin [Microbulbifer donghaiensis]SHG20218.1 type IV fimbrial biogenesis protein FimT [Microbulbifer donghaiensis]